LFEEGRLKGDHFDLFEQLARGRTISEIARASGAKPDTVKHQWQRLRLRIRELLNEGGGT
jgi:DNA-directed RNA polymerase specialized sigma24 family protein